MSKLSPLSLTLLLVLPVLAGCSSMQAPSKEQTLTNPGDGLGPGYTSTPSASVQPSSIGGENLNEAPPARDNSLTGNFDFDNPPAQYLLASVHFDFDMYNIRASERPALEAAAKKIAADPTMRVVAVGHTDWIGSQEYNLALSERRADSVKSFAGKNGVADAQMQILAHGALGSTSDVKKDSPEAKHDRRVDVIQVPAGVDLPTAAPTTTSGTAPAAPTAQVGS